MALIPLTTTGDRPCRIFVSSRTIVSIIPKETGSIVTTVCAEGEHPIRYYVAESSQQIVDAVNNSEKIEGSGGRQPQHSVAESTPQTANAANGSERPTNSHEFIDLVPGTLRQV